MTRETPQMAKKSRDDDMNSTKEGLKEAVARLRVLAERIDYVGDTPENNLCAAYPAGRGINTVRLANDLRLILSLIGSTSLSTGLDEEGWVLVPREAAYEQLRAMSESRAVDDEGPFPPLLDLLDFSGENKVYTVLRAAYRAALSAAPATVLSGGDMSSVAESALSLHGDSTETEGH